MIDNWLGKRRSPTVFPPNSMTDQIYDYLRESILINDIEAEEHLVEARLSEFFGASRTPIREAFRRLEQDGLVDRVPQGGVRVAPLNKRTLREVLNIRLVLEAYAAELTCDNINPEELDQLKRIIDQANIYLTSGESLSNEKIREIWKLNNLFHNTLLQATRNEQLIKILDQLRQMVQRFRILPHFDNETRTRSWQEHKLMIKHLEKRDKDALKALWREHLEHAANAAFKMLTSRKPTSNIEKSKIDTKGKPTILQN